MAISLKSKVDFLFKKLGFNVTRTDSDSLKGATNESIPSPLVIRGDLTWNKAGAIPIAIPASSSSIVEVYGSNNLIETTNDGTSSTNRTWLTGLTNWINPEFGATYQVKVYVHTSNDSDSAAHISKQVFASGSGNDDEWFFDYSSGVLHFMGENLPNGVSFSGKSVYISGARYVGPLGLDEFVPNAMNESDQATVARHTKEIDQLRIDTDSDHAAFQLKISSIAGIGDSDLSASAQLRNDVDSLRLDVDSDTTFIQTLKTKQSLLKNAIDSDYALFQSKISEIQGIEDSDLTVMAILRNDVDTLKLDRDSDTIILQTLKTKQSLLKDAIDSDYALFQTKISNIKGIEDSDLTVVSILRNNVDSLRSDVDSDTTFIQTLKTKQSELKDAIDSDYALFQTKLSNVKGLEDSDLTVVATLRNDVDTLKLDRDSDTTIVQTLKTKQSLLKDAIDSDYALFQTKLNAITGIGDSDLAVVAALRNDVDKNDSDVINLNAKVNSLMSDRDSDTIVIQDLNRRMNILEAAVGVTPSQPDATPIPTDSETLGIVQFSTDSDNVLENNITVTWRVIAGDGATVTINTVLFAKGMTDANVLQILYINIIDHPVANRYWEVFALRNGNKIEYAFKEKYSILGYTLTVAVTNSSDNASFVNTVPSS
tara:strand:+ start:2347 stop:4305 length:1959 start_codon:yes stop_codon:yes gene_type:complete